MSKTADPEKVLGELYRRTPMQSTFGINMLALVDGEPHLLTLKHALRVFIEHRLTVIRRRSEFELERARQRAHILDGLRIALEYLDEVIHLIRSSQDVESAKNRLVTRFKLSELQAQAILDMQLRRLASLERKKIEQEYKDLQEQIAGLEILLKSPRKMRQVVIDELQAVKLAYGDRRRTQIASFKEGASAAAMLTTNDVTSEQTVWVAVTEDGKIARTHDDNPPKASGRDAPYWMLKTSSHHTLYLVTDQGQAAALPVHALPEAEQPSDGAPVSRVSPLPDGEPLAAVFSMPQKAGGQEERFLMTASRAGMVKKTPAVELPGPSAQPFTLVKINEGDSLGWVRLTDGKTDLLLMTARGMAIRFNEAEVRPMGLVAAGVSGIKLGVGDELIGASTLPASGEVMILASDGSAKRTPISEFPLQGRYGQGVIACRLAQSAQLVGMMVGKGALRGTLHFSRAASRFMRLDEAPLKNRTARGDAVVEVKAGDHLLAITEPWDALALWEEEKKSEPRNSEPSAPEPGVAEPRNPEPDNRPGSRKSSKTT
jgi:DNA gyrase subunit A